jgi:hypothetical protein
MSHRRISTWSIVVALLAAGPAHAVELHDLKGLEDIFGRYAPAGDCKRQPLILVDVTGLTFTVGGKSQKVTNPEFAASFGPADYAGISRWILPFRLKDGYSILMTFNANETKGALLIDPQDEGYAGGLKLSPLNQALVSGSPYARCKS